MAITSDAVAAHNQRSAFVWSQGGSHYDDVSRGIADALSHAAQRLWPRPGERFLDVATGTGWTARNVSHRGAKVVGVDIAEDLLEAARALSSGPNAPQFQLADAEKLPFENHSFDGVISTFGVMFAGNQERAAAELARVCKPGGRLVLTTWDPAGSIGRFFAVVGKHNPKPPPPVSPMVWGKEERVSELLGAAFDLRFEKASSMIYYPDGTAVWDLMSKAFGPIKMLAESLDETARSAFRRDFIDFHKDYETENGLVMPRDYLLTMGLKKE